MEFLLQFLPIIIYFLLIIVIIVGIVLGIKLIITIDKVLKLVDEVNEKVEKVTPLFDTLGLLSDKVNGIVGTVISTLENFILKLFFKNKNKEEMESEIDE